MVMAVQKFLEYENRELPDLLTFMRINQSANVNYLNIWPCGFRGSKKPYRSAAHFV
jgi:hypothetical protein